MLIKLTTDRTVSGAAAALRSAGMANGCEVMPVPNLPETPTGKDNGFVRECLVFEVWPPQQAKKALDGNLGPLAALLCRVSIGSENGRTVLATLKPTTLLAMFEQPHLNTVAQEVEATLVKVMTEAASAGPDHPALQASSPEGCTSSPEPSAEAVRAVVRWMAGFHADCARLKELLQSLAEALEPVRRIGTRAGLDDGFTAGWNRDWRRLGEVLDRLLEIADRLDRIIGSSESDRVASATAAWEALQSGDDQLGESLGRLRAQAAVMDLAARKDWNLLARPLEADLENIHCRVQSLRIKLELLKKRSGEEVDRVLDLLLAQIRTRRADGQSQAYDHQYRDAAIELGREQHEFRGLLDVVKGLWMWVESPAERMHKNRSLGVDEHELPPSRPVPVA